MRRVAIGLIACPGRSRDCTSCGGCVLTDRPPRRVASLRRASRSAGGHGSSSVPLAAGAVQQ